MGEKRKVEGSLNIFVLGRIYEVRLFYGSGIREA